MFKSGDNGVTWNQTSLNDQNTRSLTADGSNIFAGCVASPQFYVSTDNGTSWTAKAEGFPGNAYLNALLVYNNYIYAGSEIGLYKRSLSEIVGIRQISNKVPNRYSLSLNYPNPFNPSTRIKLDLSAGNFVKLVIYDAEGKELESLVNKQLKAGSYETVWNASAYPSGIYFYTFTAGGFKQSDKMLLIK